MATPLIVVDMQCWYSITLHEPLVQSVCKHVKKAVKQNAPIVLVELRGKGETISEIYQELKGYRNWMAVLKNKSDGSDAALSVLEELGCPHPKKVNVCGIFSCDCIYRTVLGLTEKGIRVTVIEEACGDKLSHHLNSIENMKELHLVSVNYQGFQKQCLT